VTWTLNKKQDAMTDLYDTTIESTQQNDDGVVAHVVGRCLNRGHVRFTALIVDSKGNPTISFPDNKGRDRINVNEASPKTFGTNAYRNELIIAESDVTDSFPLAAIWRWLVEVETNRGRLLIRLPMYDEHMQEFIGARTSRGQQ
jgi:hypothetical protein